MAGGRDSGTPVAGDGDSATADATAPITSEIPTPAAVCGDDGATGYVVWHRSHLRLDDHRALARAVADGDAVCPLFVFDPAFYDADGLACDARLRVLHEAVTSLARLYAATPAPAETRDAARSGEQFADAAPLDPERSETAADDDRPETLDYPESRGLTVGYGDPVALLSRFVDRGWSVLTMATPTSRYGRRRDERVRAACGDAVEFVSGDGLVRDREWTRADWQAHVREWLAAPQHAPAWDEHGTTRLVIDTGVTPALVDAGFEVAPTKTQVPTGTHRTASTRLCEFVDRIHDYPGNISAPQDAREGTSGLSPYLTFGLLSVRQVHQYVTDNAPACRGREMFTSRLVWNLHYNQKLADWPGWTTQAVNPVFEGFNEDRHDPALVDAWKRGRTGFPMVDAAMRCLRRTGWLNFRMRAMCASFFAHILQQPWWIGADWYHHHLVDSDVGINYTQWQSQAGLVGKPSQRVYNPRKQVRDHDPEGEWITRWVPELAPLPSQFLDRPERTPLAVQADCGVTIGVEYPRPVVDFEARREAFWTRYERHRPAAARALARPAIAKRASFSGGYDAARAIAEKHGDGTDAEDGTQVSLADALDDGAATAGSTPDEPDADATAGIDEQPSEDTELPTGVGERAGEPSPDDSMATPERGRAEDATDETADDDSDDDGPDGQTTIGRFD